MEPIIMLERRQDLFPGKFNWQGRIFEVESVTECRTVLASSGRSESYRFLVRCDGRLLCLSQSLTSGQWMLLED